MNTEFLGGICRQLQRHPPLMKCRVWRHIFDSLFLVLLPSPLPGNTQNNKITYSKIDTWDAVHDDENVGIRQLLEAIIQTNWKEIEYCNWKFIIENQWNKPLYCVKVEMSRSLCVKVTYQGTGRRASGGQRRRTTTWSVDVQIRRRWWGCCSWHSWGPTMCRSGRSKGWSLKSNERWGMNSWSNGNPGAKLA